MYVYHFPSEQDYQYTMNSSISFLKPWSCEDKGLCIILLVIFLSILIILILTIIILYTSVYGEDIPKKLRREKGTRKKHFKSTGDSLDDQSMTLLKETDDQMVHDIYRVSNESYVPPDIMHSPTDSLISLSSQFNSTTQPSTETNDNLINIDLTNIPIRRLNQSKQIDPTILQLSDRPSFDACDNQYVAAFKRHNKARSQARKQRFSTSISIDSKAIDENSL